MSIPKKRLLIGFAVFFIGLLTGLVIFFPLQKIKSAVVSQLSKQIGMDLEITKMTFGTGLGLGLSKGALVALHMDQLNLIDPSGKSLSCHHAVIAPHLISLFRLHLTVGISCDLDSGDSKNLGSLTALIILKPLFAPSQFSAELDLDSLNLAHLINFAGARLPTKIELSGQASGSVGIANIPLGRASDGAGPSGTIDLKFEQLLLSDLEIQNAPLFSLPLNLGKTTLKGSLEPGKLAISNLDFQSDELNGAMEMNFAMGKTGLPQSGLWKGKVKAVAPTPDRELSYLLESNFGPIDPSGFRDFTKQFDNGNFMALMGKPTE